MSELVRFSSGDNEVAQRTQMDPQNPTAKFVPLEPGQVLFGLEVIEDGSLLGTIYYDYKDKNGIITRVSMGNGGTGGSGGGGGIIRTLATTDGKHESEETTAKANVVIPLPKKIFADLISAKTQFAFPKVHDSSNTAYVNEDAAPGQSYLYGNGLHMVNPFSTLQDSWIRTIGTKGSAEATLELAMRDNASSEYIYDQIVARHYKADGTIVTDSNGRKREVVILGKNGESLFPGPVTSNGGFIGDVTGNASSATKAKNDWYDQVIDTTYLSKVIKTKNDGSVFEITSYDGRYTPVGSADAKKDVITILGASTTIAGLVTTGDQIFTGNKTINSSGSLTIAKQGGFIYSGILEDKASNLNLPIWFATGGVNGTPKYSTELTYNPSTGTLTAKKFAGPATSATYDAEGGAIHDKYLKRAGGTMTGALNFADNTYNKFGDDVEVGSRNATGKLTIHGLNGATGIVFAPYSGSTSQTISIDGAGVMTITGTVQTTLQGNADTATTLKTARNFNITDSSAAYSGPNVSFNGSADVTLHMPDTFAGTLKGNADSATKLKTARTLWGQSFNGSANVTGAMSNVGNITSLKTNTHDIGSSSNVWKNIYATTFHGALDGKATSAGSADMANQVTHTLTIEGQIYDGSVDIAVGNTVFYIVGNSSDTTAGTWTGTDSRIKSYYNGLTIIYVPKVAGASTTTLNLNGLGAKTCHYTNTSKLTTHFSAGTPILLTYVDGYWKRADYDSNTNTQIRVYRQVTSDSSYNAEYPLLVSRTQASGIGTAGSNSSYTAVYGVMSDDTSKIPTVNVHTGAITAQSFKGMASNALNDANGNKIDETYVKLAGDTMTGSLTTPTLTLSSTSGVAHLKFSRANANYITAPASGYFAFLPNGLSVALANAPLVVAATSIYPGTTNVVSLGTSTYKWKNVYATTFTGALSGNASTASKWQTARNFQTDLALDNPSTVKVDGSTDVIIPITGILATKHGGTGNSTHTANRLVWSESATKLSATNNHYASATQIAVNSTAAPTGYTFLVNGKTHLNGDARVTGNLLMTTGGSSIYWDNGDVRQRIITTDDSTADTAVFTFQQSENTATSWNNLLTIRDNGRIVVQNEKGGIYKLVTTANTSPLIQLVSDNQDVSIFKVASGTSIIDSWSCGFDLKYIGTGANVNNVLTLYAGDYANTKAQVIGWSVNQAGQMGIRTTPNTSYALNINGNTLTNGTVYINNSTEAGADNAGALVVGPKGGVNLGIDGNEITARNNQAVSTLYLNPHGGLVQIGAGGLHVTGQTKTDGPLLIGSDVDGRGKNYIAFYGTTSDGAGSYNHTYIGENRYGDTESSELVLFKGADIGNAPENMRVVSGAGPDRIRHIAAGHLFQAFRTTTAKRSGTFADICAAADDANLVNVFEVNNKGVVVYGVGTDTQDYPAKITFKVKDTVSAQEYGAYIAVYNDHNTSAANGANLVINPGGNAFVGSGESPANLYALHKSTTTENLFLTSDGAAYLYANAQTIANRVGITISTAGHILPQKAEAANSNALNIGANNNYFANIYSRWLYANTGGTATDGGISLYSNANTTYFIAMRGTGTASGQLGTHGYVTNDYATYFGMSTNSTSTPNRGWIFRETRTGLNVASISTRGWAQFNGICLNRQNDTGSDRVVGSSKIHHGYLSWYGPTWKNWVTYMSDATSNSCPTGGTPSTLGKVTTWALRSVIQNISGYGWVWESSAIQTTAEADPTTKPRAIMSLDSNFGQLRIAPKAASTTTQTAGLIVSSAEGGSSGDTAIELWRGGNVSWQIRNSGGVLYFMNNYAGSTVNASTYNVNSLILDHATGAGSIPYLAIGQTARNTSYRLYVNGTSYLGGNTIIKGHLTPDADSTYDVGSTSKHWRYGYFDGMFISADTGFTATAGNQGKAGTYAGPGYFEMTASTPYIDFHNANSTADFSARIISDGANRLSIKQGGTPVALSYNSRSITPLLQVNGVLYGSSAIESAEYFLNNRASAGGGFYIYGNAKQYGRFYMQTVGTTSAVGITQLEVGNSTASGTANNARGRIYVYGQTASVKMALDPATYGNFYMYATDASTYYKDTAGGTAVNYWQIYNSDHDLIFRTHTAGNTTTAGSWKYIKMFRNGGLALNSTGQSVTPLGGSAITFILRAEGAGYFNGDVYCTSSFIANATSSTKNRGFIARNNSVQYARLYVHTVGTAGDGTNNGTTGIAMLNLGNSTAVAASGGADNARGLIRIYGANANYTDIYAQANGNRTLYLPNYAGTMYLVHAGNNNAIGNATTPVYIAANGRVTACTSYTAALDGRYVNVSGDTMTGALTTTYLTVTAQDTAHEGGEIKLNPAKSSYKTIHIDSYDNYFRLHDGTTERFKVDMTNGTVTAAKFNGPATEVKANQSAPAYNQTLTYFSGQIPLGTAAGNAYAGSSNNRNLWSFPAGNGDENGSVANVQVLRMSWGTTYWQEIFCNPNRFQLWYRAVRSGTADAWKRIWIEGNSVTGAVWNDYAECREADTTEYGYVLTETGKDSLTKTTERLQHFAGVSSDTWGFSQGETEKAKTPIAVAGRVLVYPYQDRDNYQPGDCVCAAPSGTVDIMTREEVVQYPDRIVGTVSCVPDYEEWGGGEGADRDPVKVNGRIWIKVR